MNPYAPSGTIIEQHPQPVCLQRRWDLIVIAFVLGIGAVISFVAIAVPSVRAFLMPRFGGNGLTLMLFPLNFLCLYLWKPAPRLIAAACGMCIIVAILNALMILRTGTVTTVANVFHDRLPSSYAYSVYPMLAIGAYLGTIAWRTRSHVAVEPGANDLG